MSILTNTGTINSSELERSRVGWLCHVPAVELSGTSRSAAKTSRSKKPLKTPKHPKVVRRIDLEAPDAGEGSLYHDDREFKHGRSRG